MNQSIKITDELAKEAVQMVVSICRGIIEHDANAQAVIGADDIKYLRQWFREVEELNGRKLADKAKVNG